MQLLLLPQECSLSLTAKHKTAMLYPTSIDAKRSSKTFPVSYADTAVLYIYIYIYIHIHINIYVYLYVIT